MPMKYLAPLVVLIGLSFLSSCRERAATIKEFKKGTFGYDSAFLAKYDSTTIELKDETGTARLLVSPVWQGRVMTSTSTGADGNSYGWLNYDLLASGKKRKQFNPVGGEERLWLGPEGGQFSLYFAPGDTFKISRWQVPPGIDTLPYKIQSRTSNQVMVGLEATFKNYSGTEFTLGIERRVRLLRVAEMESLLGTTIPQGIQAISYETLNRIENKAGGTWRKETGLVSVWLLSMMTPSDSTTVIIPFYPSDSARSKINTNYFGEIPADRLRIRDSVLFFTCDGKFRSKIGLPPSIAKPMAASYDASRRILSFILFPVQDNGLYVNSKWEIQKRPFSGDVVNSYNDGPLENGEQLGPFYELESSSAAKELILGGSMTYVQVTVHLEGDFEGLNEIARKTLGVDLSQLNP